MKLKLSLDKAAVQQFFLEHAEKIVFGGIAVCGLLILYGAYGNGKEGTPLKPSELKSSAQATKAHIEKDRTAEVQKTLTVEDYPRVASWSRKPVEVKPYDWDWPISPPPTKQDVRREKPPLLAVTDLKAQADRGGLLLSRVNAGVAGVAGAADSPTVAGKRWVLLTGLVPVRKQYEAYFETLGKAAYYDPATDMPEWKWFIVERAEAPAGTAADKLEFKPIVLRDAYVALQQFQPQLDAYPELTVNKRLALPLPVRVDKPWGDEVYPEPYTGPRYAKVQPKPAAFKDQVVNWSTESSREVPNKPRVVYTRHPFGAFKSTPAEYFAVDFPNPDVLRNAMRPGPIEATIVGEVSENVVDETTRALQTATIPLLQYQVAGAAGAPQTPRNPLDPDDPLAGIPADGGGPRSYEGGGGGGISYGQEGVGRVGNAADIVRQAKWALFRFIDLDVKPGRTYYYQVRLVLRNPNYNRPAAQLRDPKDTVDQTITTDVAGPTEPVAIPSDTHLLALGVAVKPNADPSAEMGIVRWLEKNGSEAHKKFTSWRGVVLNFPPSDFPPQPPPQRVRPPRPARGGGAAEEGVSHPPPPPRGGRPGGEGRPGPGPGPGPGREGGRPGRGGDYGEGVHYADQPSTVTPVVEQVSVNYSTNAMVLDMYGVAGASSGVGEVLVLDAAGKLRVYNVVDGKVEFDTREADLRRLMESGPSEGGVVNPVGEGGGGLENFR